MFLISKKGKTWSLYDVNQLSKIFLFQSLAGCCFVTYYSRKSALEAQNALHNMKILPGVGDSPWFALSSHVQFTLKPWTWIFGYPSEKWIEIKHILSVWKEIKSLILRHQRLLISVTSLFFSAVVHRGALSIYPPDSLHSSWCDVPNNTGKIEK